MSRQILILLVIVTVTVYSVTVTLALRLERAKETAAVVPAARGFPRQVVLPDGSSASLEAPPRAVVASSARALDFCAALLSPERVAGLPRDAIEYATLGEATAAYAARPTFSTYDAETLLALRPDLVVADPWQSLDTHERLRRAGVPVLVLPEASRLGDMLELLQCLGRLVGEERRATLEIAALGARVARLAARAVDRPRLSVLPYSSFGTQTYTAGAGTTLHEALCLAGLENAFAAQGGRGHQTLDLEATLRLAPDAFLLAEPLAAPVGPSGDRGGAAEDLLLSEPALAALTAVKERRFLRLPAGLYASASFGIVTAAERLADEADRVLGLSESDHP